MINCTTTVQTVAMKLIRKLTLMLIQEALPLKFKTSSIAETSVRNVPLLNVPLSGNFGYNPQCHQL